MIKMLANPVIIKLGHAIGLLFAAGIALGTILAKIIAAPGC